MKILYISEDLHKKLKIRAIHNSLNLQEQTALLLTQALKHK